MARCLHRLVDLDGCGISVHGQWCHAVFQQLGLADDPLDVITSVLLEILGVGCSGLQIGKADGEGFHDGWIRCEHGKHLIWEPLASVPLWSVWELCSGQDATVCVGDADARATWLVILMVEEHHATSLEESAVVDTLWHHHLSLLIHCV